MKKLLLLLLCVAAVYLYINKPELLQGIPQQLSKQLPEAAQELLAQNHSDVILRYNRPLKINAVTCN